MKAKILSCLICLLFCIPALAQNTCSVKGIIGDSVDHSKLVNASVAILNAKDSTLVKYTRTADNGFFVVNGLKKGKFILLLAYPAYADYVDNFILDSAHQEYNFDNISMQLKSRILKEVIIKGTRAAIKIKGDTTEFDPRAYVIQPNSKVEDLLKQLPGMQVYKDGKITAQGVQVTKVLLDGDEFFGDDPTLVTQNIRGDMVDKVQLYDKKSEQAALTGIDDGQKTKTINIKLKEDKKNGSFGKEDIGYGTDGYYQAQLLYNKFSSKQKFSAYATISNDGKTGVSYQDNQTLGTSTFGGNDDLDTFNGDYSGQGTPVAVNTGIHYDSKYDDKKVTLNANYKIGTLTVDGTDNTLSQNNLSTGGVINTTSDKTYHNYIFRNKLDITSQITLDTTSTLKLMVDGTSKHSQTKSSYLSTSKLNDTLQTVSNRDITNQADGKVFDASAFYTKKFKKKGRTFSWNLSEAYNESQAKGYLKTDIDYYNSMGIKDSSAVVDQYKTNHLTSSQFSSNMSYSEPFSKTFSLVLNYRFGIDNNTADRKSFDKAPDGSYAVFDTAYSNNYKLKQLTNQAGAIFSYRKGKTLLNFGTRVSDVSFDQVNEYTGDDFKRTFINWNPQALYQYRFAQQSTFTINYFGNTRQPSVDQIQPVLVNTDPLNVFLGNPNLTPSFTSNININYNSYKILSDKYLFIGGNYSFTSNPIVNNTVIDSAGKSTTQYVNLNKEPYNYNFNATYSQNLFSSGFVGGLNLNFGGNKSYNLSSGELNAITATTYSASVRIQKNVANKYDFNFSFGPNVTYGGSSLQHNINNNGHGSSGNGGFDVYLPWNILIASDLSYQHNSKTETFDQDYSKFLMNAWIVKSLDKEKNFKVTLICNDVFNQNSGFSRTSSGNLITQENSTSIKRFFMLTILWDFNKMGGSVKKMMDMKYKSVLTAMLILLSSRLIFAQHAHFTTSGTIEFNKTVNMYALLKKQINKANESYYTSYLESYRKNNPQFKTLKSTLIFGGNKTLFTPAASEGISNIYFGGGPMIDQNNTIYTDLNIDGKISQKQVFEETFLLKDSTRKIKWKVTDETREILGFTCRRANAIILDSIYVVAFYAPDIPVSGGPESFCGLPGMILEVALPHENVTWLATKVTDITQAPGVIVPPKKGKPINEKALRATLDKTLKNRGSYLKGYYLGFSVIEVGTM